MEALSSHWITIITAALCVAVLPFKDSTLRLCSAWFFAEIACDFFTTGFSTYANAAQMVSYRYLYAITSVLFILYVIKNNHKFSKSLTTVMFLVCLFSVASGAYHWFIRSNWGSWGEDFYLQFGLMVDWIYFTITVALEALMVLLGVYSAMVSIRSNDGKRLER